MSLHAFLLFLFLLHYICTVQPSWKSRKFKMVWIKSWHLHLELTFPYHIVSSSINYQLLTINYRTVPLSYLSKYQPSTGGTFFHMLTLFFFPHSNFKILRYAFSCFCIPYTPTHSCMHGLIKSHSTHPMHIPFFFFSIRHSPFSVFHSPLIVSPVFFSFPKHNNDLVSYTLYPLLYFLSTLEE